MAGIGFELRKILRKDTYFSELTAYLYAALVSSGPWLLSVVCLSALGLYRGGADVDLGQEIFRSTIIYCFAFSLILVGLVQMVVTSYLADRFYLGDHQVTLPAFFTSCVVVLGTATPLAVVGIWTFDVTELFKACAVVLFLVICLIWLAMIFLSAIKDYKNIVYAFGAGMIASVALAVFMDQLFGLNGYIMGYTLGQAVIFFWLLARLLAEFPPGKAWDAELFAYFGKYWDLALIGLFYNLAIWVDKFVFWAAPDTRMVIPWFFTHDLYEAPVFLAYLSIVPTLATFLIKTETKFYEHYRNYYAKIMHKHSYKEILEEKGQMGAMLKESAREIFILQGGLTLLCLAFAPQIVHATNLAALQIPILRISLVGAFLQALLSVNMIILFYFDLRMRVLAVTLVFLVSNAGLTWITTRLGVQFYGYGYCYACLISLLFAFYLLAKSMDSLEYITFAKQPLA